MGSVAQTLLLLICFMIPVFAVNGQKSFIVIFTFLLLLALPAFLYLSDPDINRAGDVAGALLVIGGIIFYIPALMGLIARSASLFAQRLDHFRPKSLWIEATVFSLLIFLELDFWYFGHLPFLHNW